MNYKTENTVENSPALSPLVPTLRAWARHEVHVGISCSWGTVEKYSAVFTTACVTMGACRGPDRISPDIAVEVSHDALTYRFPHGHWDKAVRGMLNESFLHALPVCEQCLAPLQGRRLVVLSVAHIYRTEQLSLAAFLDRLGRFLDALPRTFSYAVKLHNSEYLLPDYFACLQERNAAHVIHAHAHMPPLLEQVLLPHVFTSDVAVVHAAVVHPQEYIGVAEAVRRCVAENIKLYIHIPDDATVLSRTAMLLEVLNPDLAAISPFRRKAA